MPVRLKTYFQSVVDGSAWPQAMPFSTSQGFGNYLSSGRLMDYVQALVDYGAYHANLSSRLQNKITSLEAAMSEQQVSSNASWRKRTPTFKFKRNRQKNKSMAALSKKGGQIKKRRNETWYVFICWTCTLYIY